MEPLSDVLALLQPQAIGWRVIEAHNAWTLRFLPKPEVVVFGQAIEGGCSVYRDDGQAFEVSAGDFILMASPPPWEMRALGGGPPVDFKALLADPTLLAGDRAPQTVTRFMAGHFTFAAAGATLLGRLMLPIVHIRAADAAAGRIGALLALLSEEALADRPGGPEVIKRLLEILLVEALRRPGVGWDQAHGGLLKGLADRQVGQALKLMHGDMRRGWTVGELARAVGMSRSMFAARFSQYVGLPPREYLASWRMTLARQALLAGTTPMADVAELAGYRSVSAFSTAFSRQAGASPTRYARAVARSETAAAG